MSVSSLVLCLVVLLLQLWGAHTLPPTPPCINHCLCHKTPLLNCSSSGLSEAPSQIPVTATALDLSHNALQSLVPLGSGRLRGLQHLWVGDNALETLSLCLGKGLKATKTLTGRRERCLTWAPDLQLLSAERNQLKRIPGGLCSIKSLQVLQLSHNRISELGPTDLFGCTDLKEVHLQHNLINTVHPQAFKDLPSLQVLDLSYNLLTIIPLPAYLSLRNLNTLVAISGNRWRCDCNLKTIRRWLSFDNEVGNPGWKVVCFSPPHNAGKDLLHLKESDLTCPPPVYSTPGLVKEVTVDESTELLLSCATQDFMQAHWWTPHGQVSENQQVLLISNVTEQHAGLYVCVSGFQEEHVSIFNLHVHKRVHDTRLRREAQNILDDLTKEANLNIQRNVRTVSQQDFVLAVCLSVSITFIVAFVIGVLVRPLLDKLCKKIRSKRDTASSSINSQTSSTRQRPYVNEGYSDADEGVQEVRVGSRVTFGGVTEVNDCGGNIPYYVTVEDAKSDSSSENNTDVDISYEKTQGNESFTENVENHCVEMEDLKSREGSHPSSSLQVSKEVLLRKENTKTSEPKPACGYPNAESTKIMEFEPIPDQEDTTELEETSISPVSSQSELPQELESYEVKESFEQSVDPPVVTVHEDKEGNTGQEATIPGFTTDPLFDLKEQNVDDLDPDLWNDSGDSFSFTDESPRSSSRVTQLAVLDYPLFEKEMSVDKSEEEQAEYTVNPEEDEESETYPHSGNEDLNGNKLSTPEQDALTDEPSTGARFRQDTITLDPSDVHLTCTREDSFDDWPFTDQNESSDSSNIVHINEEPAQYHVHPVYRTGRKTTNHLGKDRSGACSSSEDEEEQAENAYYPRRLEIKTEPEVNSEGVIPVKNPNNIFSINFDNSSSSTDIEEKTDKEGERKSFKRLSGLSSLLFNRNGAETDKKVAQTPSKTTNKDSWKIGGILGLSFNKQTVVPEDNDNPNTNKESFFGAIEQAFGQLPKLKRSLLFSVSQPESSIQHRSAPVVEAGYDSKISQLNFSLEESFIGKIDVPLDPVPKIKRYLLFSHPEPSDLIPSFIQTERATPELKTETQSVRSESTLEDKLSPNSTEDSFFGQIGASLDEVPMVKRYIQFTQSEPQPSAKSPSTSLKTESFIPVLGSKPRSVKSDSSSEDDISPTSTRDHFFGQIGASLDEVPKVNRYIQFTQSEPQPSAKSPSTSLKTESFIPVLGTKPQSVKSDSSSEDDISPSSTGDNFFGQIGASLDGVPKMNRYIQFTQSEPQLSTQSPPTSSKAESFIPVLGTKTQSVRSESTSEDKLSPTTTGDNFFGQIGATLDELPKVERYIQFTQSEPQLSTQSPPTSLKAESFIPVLGTKTQSVRSESTSEDKVNPTSTEDSFFGKISASLNEVPKVKRYIQFSQSEPQPSAKSPSTSVKAESFITVLGTKPQSVKSDSSSEDDNSPTSTGDSFFEQIGASLNEVPKVQRYIQFTQSEPQSSVKSPSTSLKSESFIPVLGTKLQSVRSESTSKDKLSATCTGDHFFGQIGASLDEVPKVNRYIQFTQSEPQPSVESPSTSLKAESFIPVLGTKPQSVRSESTSEDKLSPTTTGDNFFGQIGATLDELPKVERYIQFTQSEPQLSTQSPPTSSKAESFIRVLGTKTQSVRSESTSEDKLSPTTTGDHFFGQIGATLDELPKVERYIQFTQSEPQLSTQSPPTSLKAESFIPGLGTKTQSVRSESTSEDKVSPTSTGDNFFGQIGASLDEVPKVNRYIQFTRSEPQPSVESPSTSLKAESVLGTKLQSVRSECTSMDKLSPTSTGDNFFGQIGTSLDEVVKVKRYIQLTQSEAQPSVKSPSTSLKAESVIPVLGTKSQSVRSESTAEDKLSLNSTGDNFFGQIDASLDEVPKVNRYIQFTQSEPQSSVKSPSTSLKAESFIPVLESKPHSVRSESIAEDKLSPNCSGDNFFGQIGASLDEVPKVNRYIQFTQSEAQPSAQFPSTSLKAESFISVLGTKPQSVRSESTAEDKLSLTSTGDNFFGQIDASLDEVPKVNRYIQFTQSEPQSSVKSPSTSLKAESFIPVLESKPHSVRSEFSSKDKLSPTSNGDNFFGQIGTSFDGVPKVKRYIQFTQSEPQPSDLLPSFMKTERITKVQSGRYNLPSENELSSPRKEGNFFGQIGTSLNEVPKVKRYIQFTQTESSAETPTSSHSERVTPTFATKIQSVRSDPPSEVRLTTPSNGDSFFGQIDGVPKLKRYIQFTQSEPISQTPSNEPKIHAGMVININSSSEDGVKADADSFFGQIDTSLDGIPKVKRYLQFTQHLTQPSSQFLDTQIATPELLTKTELLQTSSTPDYIKPINKDSLFGNTDTPLYGITKVKRYIQFTQCESHSSDYTSDNEAKPSSNKDNFFEGIYISPDHIPEVKRSLQFTQSHPKLENQLFSPSLNKERITTEFVTKREPVSSNYSADRDIRPNNQDSLFDQLNTSFDGVPKVNRYIRFSQSEDCLPNTKYPSTEKARESDSLSEKEFSTTTTENSFLQIHTSLHEVPKVKTYIHFTQSEPQTLSPHPHTQIPICTPKDRRVESMDSEVNVSVKDEDFFWQIPASFSTLQRPKRSLIFTTSDPQNQNQIQALSLIHDSSFNVKVSTEKSRLEQLPRPKRTLYFSNSDPYRQSHQPLTQTELATSEFETIESRLSSLGAPLSTESSDFSPHNLPIPTRSLQFPTSEELSEQVTDLDQVPKLRTSLGTDTPLQDENKTPTTSSGKDGAREYLRDSSQARLRQERRRLLFQQKRRAMDGFSLTSPSSTSQERDKQGGPSDHYEGTVRPHADHSLQGVPTVPASSASHMDAKGSGFKGLSAKRISSLKYKSALHEGTYKSRSDD
ncbi:uncharacterized protein LOC108414988 isoform X2 [Pygocentrus nattereri]|uniref:uncharacterized protein LOC108414988 isoform X2 n=1 Tax=Pygocentrus nattereri TaxID=42514 RepID=UPI0008149517|nr:uncharacterized protein LOC108414988 isoform X2 [Pygocentrus nattereri]